MELRIQVQDFAKNLAAVQGIVQKRNTMPILASVLIEADEEGGVSIIATDLDIGIRITSQAEVLEAGSVAVNARALYDIIKALPSSEATLKRLDNNFVELRAGRVHYKILGANTHEFPSLPEVGDTALLTLDAATLKEMIEKTFYSVSTDETRYNLNGVFFEQKEDHYVTMVSTDGHRLSRISKPMDIDLNLKDGVILPRKGLAELRKLSEKGQGNLQFGIKGNQVVAEYAGMTVVMRLVDGTFPDYSQVIPKEVLKRVRLNREGFIESLRRIALVSNDKSHSVRVELSPGNLRISSQNPDLGEGEEQLPVEYDGEAISIGFNAHYVIDALNAIDESEVVLELNDDLSPGVLRGVDSESYLCVVMPMRI